MSKTKLAVKVAAHLAVLLITYILQACAFPYIRLGGITPMLLLSFTVGIAVNEGGFFGGLAGLFAGVLMDNANGAPVMACTLLLTLTGIGVGYLAEKIITEGFIPFALVHLGAGFALPFLLSFGRGADFSSMLLSAMTQSAYSLIFSVPYYFICRRLARGIRPL
ncbi:MAG: hypothetical protein HUJ65_02960 [Oscillospiraceae bacterium]|nr:hypothetical protein [Oscillospiraceae bacterium]